MSGKRYTIQLTEEEREQLNRLVRGGKHAARIATRARILLKIDEGWKAPALAAALDVAEGTVYRVKRRYADEGLDGVLHDRVQANRFRKLDDKAEAHLIALACSDAPEGANAGPWNCWPTGWWSWEWWTACRMRRCASS